MSEQPTPEVIQQVRDLFIEWGVTRGGKTAEHWTDEEVIAHFHAVVKVIVAFAREFNRAVAKAVVRISEHIAQISIPAHVLPYLDGGRVAARARVR